MLYTYGECKLKFGSDYQIRKAITDGKFYRKEKGVYSDEKYVAELEIISLKYPKAIFTLNSAFYYHGMTDVIPDYYYLQTIRGAAKIKDIRVKQIFENSSEVELGRIEMLYNGTRISIYNKERMLIELIRSKNKLPFDYYKEIISSYRYKIDTLDIQEVQEYAYILPKTNMIMETLQLEVL